jgi:hypothetical protein
MELRSGSSGKAGSKCRRVLDVTDVKVYDPQNHHYQKTR